MTSSFRFNRQTGMKDHMSCHQLSIQIYAQLKNVLAMTKVSARLNFILKKKKEKIQNA